MIFKKVDLYEYFGIERGNASGGYITVYAREHLTELSEKARPAMLVIPGGGYAMLSGREGEPVAIRFLNEGYGAFVLTYSTDTKYPTPLVEACLAVSYIRRNAAEFCIDENCVAAVGFSAGGHLAGMLATFTDREVEDVIGEIVKSAHLNAVILSYPVVSLMDGVTHEGTRRIITGDDKKLYDKLSVEKRVDKNSAPAFIWHTASDDCVPVENSLLLASSYSHAKIPFSLVVYPTGWHGLSVANVETCNQTADDESLYYIGKWVDSALDFLRICGFNVHVNNKTPFSVQ